MKYLRDFYLPGVQNFTPRTFSSVLGGISSSGTFNRARVVFSHEITPNLSHLLSLAKAINSSQKALVKNMWFLLREQSKTCTE